MEPLTKVETDEGPKAEQRFVAAMKKILSVSREEMQRSEAAYQIQSNLNPKRRGPKPKNNPK